MGFGPRKGDRGRRASAQRLHSGAAFPGNQERTLEPPRRLQDTTRLGGSAGPTELRQSGNPEGPRARRKNGTKPHPGRPPTPRRERNAHRAPADAPKALRRTRSRRGTRRCTKGASAHAEQTRDLNATSRRGRQELKRVGSPSAETLALLRKDDAQRESGQDGACPGAPAGPTGPRRSQTPSGERTNRSRRPRHPSSERRQRQPRLPRTPNPPFLGRAVRRRLPGLDGANPPRRGGFAGPNGVRKHGALRSITATEREVPLPVPDQSPPRGFP
jgi:hypothetical protein